MVDFPAFQRTDKISLLSNIVFVLFVEFWFYGGKKEKQKQTNVLCLSLREEWWRVVPTEVPIRNEKDAHTKWFNPLHKTLIVCCCWTVDFSESCFPHVCIASLVIGVFFLYGDFRHSLCQRARAPAWIIESCGAGNQ